MQVHPQRLLVSPQPHTLGVASRRPFDRIDRAAQATMEPAELYHQLSVELGRGGVDVCHLLALGW